MIYVDDAIFMKPNGRKLYCHMRADSIEELHAFAEQIGVKKHFFHRGSKFPHYDLTETYRKLAVTAGAIEVSSNFLVKLKQS